MADIEKSRKERLRALERKLAQHVDFVKEGRAVIQIRLDFFIWYGFGLRQIRQDDLLGWPAYCHEHFGESSELIDDLIELAVTIGGGAP